MSLDRGMDKEDVVHTHTMELYSAIKKNEIRSFAAMWMDLESVILSKSDQEGKISYDIPYMWNLKINDTNELIYKTGLENTLMAARRKNGGRDS